jgi:flavin-dependent dehydrogenase
MNKVESIVILGGGSAGWMTASTLIKAFPNKKITLVESSSIPTVGVGESTISEFIEWLSYLGLTYEDFLKDVNGSLKIGLGFTNFVKNDNSTVFYTFGIPDLEGTYKGLTDWQYFKAINPEISDSDFVKYYYPQAESLYTDRVVMEDNPEMYPFKPYRDTAFQIDASLFGLWLANNYAIPRGVNRVVATVVDVSGNEDGIDYLRLDNGLDLHADLFIDCSGFKSMLLGGFMKEEFVSTRDLLPNNAAFAAPVEYTDKNKEMQTFTNATALGNGWVWNTPLWSRIGTGYVFNTDFIDEDSALDEFKNHLDSKNMVCYDPNRSKNMEFRKIQIKNGHYKRFWVKNVVAIGLSAGFLEPLESTGLAQIHTFSIFLVDALQRDGIVTQFDKDRYNLRTFKSFEGQYLFVALHYFLSQRNDTEYWKSITSQESSINLLEYLDVLYHRHISSIPMGWGFRDNFLTDMKIVSHQTGLNLEKEIQMLSNIRSIKTNKWAEIIKNSPTHYEFLKNNVYNN